MENILYLGKENQEILTNFDKRLLVAPMRDYF